MALENLELRQMDVQTAFLYGDLSEDIIRGNLKAMKILQNRTSSVSSKRFFMD